jgi:hypothetical protein
VGVAAEALEVRRDAAEVVNDADPIEAEQAVDQDDRKGRAARRLAGDRDHSFERRGLDPGCGTASQDDDRDREDQQQRDQREGRSHVGSLSRGGRCGEPSQAIDAIVCRGCFDARNLASWLGIMVKASRT